MEPESRLDQGYKETLNSPNKKHRLLILFYESSSKFYFYIIYFYIILKSSLHQVQSWKSDVVCEPLFKNEETKKINLGMCLG